MNIEISISRLVADATIRTCGFNDYKFLLMRFASSKDISKDILFQKRFTYFYRLRRSHNWLDKYYQTFEQTRYRKDITFEEIISTIAEFSENRIEISFASKMLSTINPDLPIWDKYIRDNLDLPQIPPTNTPDRFEQAVRAYDALVEKMNYLLSTEKVQKELSEFDRLFPAYSDFAPMKKLDYLIWGLNRVETPEIKP